MRFVAFLLVAGSLVLGLVAAANAYLAPLSLADEALVGLVPLDTIADPAGGPPLVRKGEPVDAAALERLRRADVKRLRVEQFSLSRWSGSWLFGLACLGLVAGAVATRLARRTDEAATESASAGSPAALLGSIEASVRSLLERWPRLSGDEARCRETLASLDPVVAEKLPSFAAARPAMVASSGIGGFAGTMDRFAAAERQIHRAWSAAADGVPAESFDCLRRALVHLDETRATLK